MARSTDPLADLDADTVDEMVADMARELGCPWDVFPEHARPGPVPLEAQGLNAGCVRSGVALYKEAQQWRRKALRELKRNPEWVEGRLAEVRLNERVEALCAERGYSFAPHETPPWAVSADGPSPWGDRGCAGALTWPAAQRLRRQLVAEIEAADRARHPRRAR
jgi:hypothetical protein